MIQVEAGKRYARRDGIVTGPLREEIGEFYPFIDELHGLSYQANGRNLVSHTTHEDLIMAYIDDDYDHLGDLQREYNETQERLAATMLCEVPVIGESDDLLSAMVQENQAMGMYDPQPMYAYRHGNSFVAVPAQSDEAQQYDDANPCWWRNEKWSQPAAVRTFASGATRNLDHNKLDYEGFNCPAAQRAFAEYMHTHRKQADGTMRDGDNWQKSIPVVEYMKSIKRHTQDLHLLHRGWTVTRPEDGIDLSPTTENKIELLCAIWFNVQGMIHELLKEERNANQSS